MSNNISPLRSNLGSFSPDLLAGKPTKGCAKCALMSALPCNLTALSLRELNAEPKGLKGTRSVDYKLAEQRQRNASPVVLRSGFDLFQMTATSKQQGSRKLVVTAKREVFCSDKHHQGLCIVGPRSSDDYPSGTASLELCRPPMPGDSGFGLGFFAVVNACWQACQNPTRYLVVAQSCGLPTEPAVAPASELRTTIEVFPADKFKLGLTLPPLLKPDVLELDKTSQKWTSDSKKKKEDLKAENVRIRSELDSYYVEQKAFFKEAQITRADLREFADEMTKKASGTDDDKYFDQLEVEFSQTDGSRTTSAPIDEVVTLVRCIRNAEWAIKQIDRWMGAATIGPGARFSVACQFLSGSISAEWGRTEYIDDRVYLAWNVQVELVLLTIDVKIELGWKCMGMADLFVTIGGAGSLSLGASGGATAPDGEPELQLVPEGKVKLSGVISATVMWAVKGSTGLECEFKAHVGDLTFMTETSLLGGEVRISREPVYRVITYSSNVYGGTNTDRHEVIKGDPNLAKFRF